MTGIAQNDKYSLTRHVQQYEQLQCGDNESPHVGYKKPRNKTQLQFTHVNFMVLLSMFF